ncbi:MAG TPA: NAD(P)H-dependent oxidoreductase subunit E [Vicinamibacterales bacterium]|nr:NAD(P)H-dependent oxidoreductase subunit E [Vicinamibacterales bacterium]
MSFHPLMAYDERLHKAERKILDEGPPFAFTPDRRATLDRIIGQYPPDQRRSAVLAALYLLQAQQGFLTANGMRHVAEILGMTPAEVDDVASYYVMFHKAPVGKYVLQVCRTLSCALMGAERITEALAEKLGVGVGETDPTGTFTLQEFECLGACDRAPVVMVNNEQWHECLKPQDAARLVDEIRSKGAAAFSGCHLKVER